MPNTDDKAMYAEKILYNLFRFLWILVILPKGAQLAAFTVLVIWWSVKYRQLIRFNKVTVWFLAYAGIHLISIIIAVLTRDHAFARIAAAFNTCGIWILAVWITGIVLQADNIDTDRIGKICTVNLIILFVLFLLSLILPQWYIFNGVEKRFIRTWDLLSSGETTRFNGLFEYPAIVSFFTLLQFPFSFRYMAGRKHRWSCLILVPVTLLPVFMTYSRLGIIVNVIMIFAAVNCLVIKSGVPVGRILTIYGIIVLLVFVGIIIKSDEFLEMAYRIFNARPGSNSDRMLIYKETINRISETSWIIGAGIKEMNSTGVYPLGSHCTYLGVVFKAGILGSVCFVVGLFRSARYIFGKNVKPKDILEYLIQVMFILVMVFCILEDIDGANWLLVIFMVIFTYNGIII